MRAASDFDSVLMGAAIVGALSLVYAAVLVVEKIMNGMAESELKRTT